MEKQINGFRVFIVILIGQTISLIGSGLTDFALAFWVLQKVVEGQGSLLNFSLIFVSIYLPGILISPLAGAVVDRFDRKMVMIISKCIAVMATILIYILVATDHLQIWHIYLATSIKSIANAFLLPAFESCISLLVHKKDYGKANGLAQTGESLHRIVSPMIAGSLLSAISLKGIIMVDFIAFVIGIMTLAFVNIKKQVKEVQVGKQLLHTEIMEGWRYIFTDKGLMSLLFYFTISNFLIGFVEVWVQPLVYSLVDLVNPNLDKAAIVGAVMTAGGFGMMVGSILMGIWGGPKDKIKGVLGFTFIGGSVIIAAGFVTSITVFAIGAFLYFVTIPIILGCNLAIWQSKVPSEKQGRVFAIRRAFALGALPLSFISAGVLGDLVEPLFHQGAFLAESIGLWIGTGQGRGYAFLFTMIGLSSMCLASIGYFYSHLRHIEDQESMSILKAEKSASSGQAK